jgi:hypothetical protein
MQFKTLFTLSAICCLVLAIACTNQTATDKTIAKDSTGIDIPPPEVRGLDTAESCAKPNKYPNQDKPMALMMRQMADHAQKMKDLVLANKPITEQAFPFIRFHLVEPTDPDVLQPQFFENARLLQQSHQAIVKAPLAKQKEMYTAYINQCINCHQIYCSGPLKRIRKLTLDFKE